MILDNVAYLRGRDPLEFVGEEFLQSTTTIEEHRLAARFLVEDLKEIFKSQIGEEGGNVKSFSLRPNSEEVHFINAGHAFKTANNGDEPRFLQALSEIGDIRRKNKNTALAECHIVKMAIAVARQLKVARVVSAGEDKLAAHSPS